VVELVRTKTVRVKAVPFIPLYIAQGQTRDERNREDGISQLGEYFFFLNPSSKRDLNNEPNGAR